MVLWECEVNDSNVFDDSAANLDIDLLSGDLNDHAEILIPESVVTRSGRTIRPQARIQRGNLGIYPPSIFWK